MSGYIQEYFGYPVFDDAKLEDEKTLKAWGTRVCPFIHETCVKKRHDGRACGVCSVHSKGDSTPVIICPQRLYGEDDKLLKLLAMDAFGVGEDDFLLVGGEPAARDAARSTPDKTVIAVFGHGWGHELPIPTASKEQQSYCSIDWILARLDSEGTPQDFCAAEVQTIDTTGSYGNAARELEANHISVKDTVGLNWANVRKRIFQQIIYKGQVLELDEHCRKGLYYVLPQPVYRDNLDSLGGKDILTRYPARPGSLTFFVYDYDPDVPFKEGELRPLRHIESYTTGIHKLQEAFSNRLPHESNLFYSAIEKALGIKD